MLTTQIRVHLKCLSVILSLSPHYLLRVVVYGWCKLLNTFLLDRTLQLFQVTPPVGDQFRELSHYFSALSICVQTEYTFLRKVGTYRQTVQSQDKFEYSDPLEVKSYSFAHSIVLMHVLFGHLWVRQLVQRLEVAHAHQNFKKLFLIENLGDLQKVAHLIELPHYILEVVQLGLHVNFRRFQLAKVWTFVSLLQFEISPFFPGLVLFVQLIASF